LLGLRFNSLQGRFSLSSTSFKQDESIHAQESREDHWPTPSRHSTSYDDHVMKRIEGLALTTDIQACVTRPPSPAIPFAQLTTGVLNPQLIQPSLAARRFCLRQRRMQRGQHGQQQSPPERCAVLPSGFRATWARGCNSVLVEAELKATVPDDNSHLDIIIALPRLQDLLDTIHPPEAGDSQANS
jgi:hypothetical protein